MGNGIYFTIGLVVIAGYLLWRKGKGWVAIGVWALLPASAMLWLLQPLPQGLEGGILVALSYGAGYLFTTLAIGWVGMAFIH